MRVFSSFESSQKANSNSKKNDTAAKANRVGTERKNDAPNVSRPKYTEGEIREKFEEHQKKIEDTLAVSDKGKMMFQKLHDKPSDDSKVKEIDGKKILSDVKLNDPKDPMTKLKLKEVLGTGSFNFSDKERSALERILNDGR